jgi:dihydroorotate dehydrogenase electron transfer subunit
VALGDTSARLKLLLLAALEQNASVVLVSDLDLTDLPSEVEIQPLSALTEITQWADYVALDILREFLPGLREKLGLSEHCPCREPVGARRQARIGFEAQVLVVTPMPCGGMGECGVCATRVRRGWKMACKDGPVFDFNELV